MKSLTETFISAVDLIEAEGRLLQQKSIQTLVIFLLAIGAAFFILLALSLFMVAGYHLLRHYFPPYLAYICLGLACFLIAGVMLIWIKVQKKKKA